MPARKTAKPARAKPRIREMSFENGPTSPELDRALTTLMDRPPKSEVVAPTPPRCGACTFWCISKEKAAREGGWGQCRRYPPQRGSGHNQFPGTYGHEWCGEFKVRS